MVVNIDRIFMVLMKLFFVCSIKIKIEEFISFLIKFLKLIRLSWTSWIIWKELWPSYFNPPSPYLFINSTSYFATSKIQAFPFSAIALFLPTFHTQNNKNCYFPYIQKYLLNNNINDIKYSLHDLPAFPPSFLHKLKAFKEWTNKNYN